MGQTFEARTRHAISIFLALDLLVFLALFAVYIWMRMQVAAWPGAFHFASGLMAFAITLFALSGSFAMHYAVRYQVTNGYEIAMRLTVATVAVMGCAFILLFMEWTRLILIVEATFTRNPWGVPAFSWAYFTLTGFYGLHLLAAMTYLTVLAARINKVDAGRATLFVHFTNIVWVFILFGIYFASADLQGI